MVMIYEDYSSCFIYASLDVQPSTWISAYEDSYICMYIYIYL